MQQKGKLMVPNFLRQIREIRFCITSYIPKNILFQIGKEIAGLTVTIVPEQQNERDCGYAAE